MKSDWKKALQQGLGVAADGVLGPVTYEALFRAMGAKGDTAIELGVAAAGCFDTYGISTGARLVQFVGETAHESAGYSAFRENLNYTSAARLAGLFSAFGKSAAAAAPYVRNPRALANKVYGGRLGNGSETSGDGWAFRGGGIIQLTGRANYAAMARATGIPLDRWPEMVATPAIGLEVAACWWRENGLNMLADRNDSKAVSGVVNCGSASATAVGLAERLALKSKVLGLMR